MLKSLPRKFHSYDRLKFSYHIILCCFLSLGASENLIAQSDFYATDHIPEIRLEFDQSNWDEILDSLYLLGEDYRLGASVTIDSLTYDKVGVRYKGFSSYSSTRDKNPLNIDLDYVYSDQSHHGYHKLKLSNVIQDPSFVREVLSYEMARSYMPASKANFANVYINDTLIGIYTNVEAVNGKFLEENLNSSANTFVKCNPETIDLNGANANLDDAPGTDISNYYPLYNMKSSNEDDWSNLYEFIHVLNNDQNSVESLLNIDRTLWMHALNYSVINFDSYVGYAQNYYLYQDHNNQFNPILWDMNMSFGSYRLTDASDNWDGFTIEEAKTIDPLAHLNSFSVHPRPLIRNLLENPMYERMYMAHLITIIEDWVVTGNYQTRAQEFQNTIDASVLADTNKFYSYQDFLDNLDSTVSDLVDYPGIIDLMEGRKDYLMNYPGVQYRPDINGVNTYSATGFAGDDVWITASVNGQVNDVYLAYRFSEMEQFTVVSMADDGLHQDGVAIDGEYGALIPNPSNQYQFYIYAENDSSGRFFPAAAAYEFLSSELRIRPNDLVINEVMSINNVEVDEFGELDDWVEIHNTTNYPISLNDMYISDESNSLDKWQLPNGYIEANDYMIIWLDSTQQGDDHANFTLTGDVDSIWISYLGGSVIDSVIVPKQYGLTSVGRFPNGSGDFQELVPTIGLENIDSERSLVSADVFVYPNPAGQSFAIKTNQDNSCELAVYSMDGRNIMPSVTMEGNSTKVIDSSNWAEGIYILSVAIEEERITKRLMITH